MKKWEYLSFYYSVDYIELSDGRKRSMHHLEDVLGELGLEGWELCTIDRFPKVELNEWELNELDALKHVSKWIFKRPIE